MRDKVFLALEKVADLMTVAAMVSTFQTGSTPNLWWWVASCLIGRGRWLIAKHAATAAVDVTTVIWGCFWREAFQVDSGLKIGSHDSVEVQEAKRS